MKIKQAKRNSSAGFTLVEVIVIVAILAILAGILVPMIFSQIDEARITRAEADCKSLSTALLVARKDLGLWPNLYGASCTPTATLLRGAGTQPANLAAMGFNAELAIRFRDVLMRDDEECYDTNMYKGPYLPGVEADPWGNQYVLGASNFNVANAPVYVLSAGPNGTLETPASSIAIGGDDIGLRIK
jgi:general secretion pathway protein G